MASIFARIVKGDLPCHKILEDERYFSFLAIHAIKPGHTLAIPKKEIDDIFDVEDELLAGLMLFSKKVAGAVRKAFPCKKVALMVYGLEVPHAHVHLVPAHGVPGELNFSNARPASDEELSAAAEKIRAYL